MLRRKFLNILHQFEVMKHLLEETVVHWCGRHVVLSCTVSQSVQISAFRKSDNSGISF